MSIGRDGIPLGNPNVCSDPYAPQFWLGKPGALTAIRMPNAGYGRPNSDHFAMHDLLDGQAVDRSPYTVRTWSFSHEWLRPEVVTVFQEYATRQRGFGPFILIDPHMKNLLTPNQAAGTDALRTTEGFTVTGSGDALSSSTDWFQQGERSLLWQQIVPSIPAQQQVYDDFNRTVANSWGNATSGQAWSQTGGTAANFGVSGTDQAGFHQLTTANVMRSTFIPTDKNAIFGGDAYFTTATSTGSTWRIWTQGRYTDQSNFYAVEYALTTTGVFTYQLVKFVAGVKTTLSSLITVPGSYVSRTAWRSEIRTVGTSIQAWVYRTTEKRPLLPTFSVTDSSLTTGGNGAMSSMMDTSGSGSPFINFDNVVANWATGGVLQLTPPTLLPGWSLPANGAFAFSGTVRGFSAADASVAVIPRVAFLNGAGQYTSVINGTTINTVTGTSTSFCVTGTMPSVTGTGAPVYARPEFVVSGVTDQSGLYIDMLQFELTPTGQCTTWEYGQGQPYVSVRNESESVPRVLRTNMGYICVEVT